MLDKRNAQELSTALKIDLFTVYREYLQLLFLKNIYSFSDSNELFFKGGTAIRFLLGSFRFSEDLDFSTHLTKVKIRELINETVKSLKKELAVEFKVEDKFSDSYSGKIYQSLEDFKIPLTIKIEISLREKVFSFDTAYIETIFPISPYPLVVHLGFEEIFAEKIRALSRRGKGRDLFDFWFLLTKGIKMNWDLINKKMILYHKKIDQEKLKEIIKEFSDKEIEKDLKRFLPRTERKIVSKMKEIALSKYITVK